MKPSRKHRSTRTDKALFLSTHRELWDAEHGAIKKELVAAGLVSPTTYFRDIGINDLLRNARKMAGKV